MFIRSYLNNKHQYTTISDSSSTLQKVHCGVPQGSVLGPLLFALYINDIQYAVGAECVTLIADDTASYMFNTDWKVLISNVKAKIQQMFKWCICNKLTINSDKTYFVLFHTVNKPVRDDLIEIVTPQMTIKQATKMKYSGLLLEEKLNYNEHVQSICNSLLKYFGIFNHIKHKVNKKTARQLYFAFVFSRIKYGIEIYGNCSERNVNKIQTRFLRYEIILLSLLESYLAGTSFEHSCMGCRYATCKKQKWKYWWIHMFMIAYLFIWCITRGSKLHELIHYISVDWALQQVIDPWRYGSNFKSTICEHMLEITFMRTSCDFAFR